MSDYAQSSKSKPYPGRAADEAELETYRRHNPKCERCHWGGYYACKDITCGLMNWSPCAEGFEPPLGSFGKRLGRGGRWELPNTHTHICDCTGSGWHILLRQRRHEGVESGGGV